MNSSVDKSLLSPRERRRGLLLLLVAGMALCVWELGSTGLVDETPPLFAAAARAMSETGDWLTPRVNGLPRFDKPPLIYWLMSIGYSLPANDIWDPLGTWAARLPSAISSVLMMLFIGDTVMRFPQKDDRYPRRTGFVTSLAFALSPLVIIWSRIAVSDALLCSTFGISMLCQWRRYVDPITQSWFIAWVVLGLAVLTKGPVAVVLMGIALASFGLQQGKLLLLWKRLRPLPGLCITALISLPWYVSEYLVEGQPFLNSFFGYHNFQRLTTVVNSHHEPWWFFLLILVVASLPFTPILVLGLLRAFDFNWNSEPIPSNKPEDSLSAFAACWLITVLFLFTCAATKLPSYWLPAIPAAALLIGLTGIPFKDHDQGLLFALGGSAFLAILLALVFWSSPFWLMSLKDPEIPNLGKELFVSGLAFRVAICLSISSIIGLVFLRKIWSGILLAMQVPLIVLQLIVITPMWNLSDRLRQLPLRQAASLLVKSMRKYEQLSMVGIIKPSLHFYTDEIIIYEGRSARALVNLSDRLSKEQRKGWSGRPISGKKGSKTVLMVIDKKTKSRAYWKGLNPEILGEFGIYSVWRVDRKNLAIRAKSISETGINPTWMSPRPERF